MVRLWSVEGRKKVNSYSHNGIEDNKTVFSKKKKRKEKQAEKAGTGGSIHDLTDFDDQPKQVAAAAGSF